MNIKFVLKIASVLILFTFLIALSMFVWSISSDIRDLRNIVEGENITPRIERTLFQFLSRPENIQIMVQGLLPRIRSLETQ